MANGRIRIGFQNPGQYSLTADYGQYTLNGQNAALIGQNVSGDAEADWQTAIAGEGVVWYHDFRSVNEVNNFRWTPAFSSGNDPNAVGSALAPLVAWDSTDGITGGSLKITRPAGTQDGSVWWRPFSPIVGGTTTGNGRGAGQDDPAANGTLTPQSYSPTSGGAQISTWGFRGFYGTTQTVGGASAYDGKEYYLRASVKMDPNRIAGGNAAEDVGKLFYFTRTDRSATDQEIVVFSAHPIGGSNYFSMYRSVGPPLDNDPPGIAVRGNQPKTSIGLDDYTAGVGDGLCRFDNNGGRLANCWKWPATAQWVTLMWHIKNGVSGNNDTVVEVFIQDQTDTEWRCIWKQPDADLPFDPDNPQGHNALICSIYHNGDNMPIQFFQGYTQIVFSTKWIPARRIPLSGAKPALITAIYALTSGQSANFATTFPFVNLPSENIAWQTIFFYDERRGLIHLMGKPANQDTQWSHAFYTIATNTWTLVSQTLFNNPGHIYGGTNIHPVTGDLYCSRGGADFPSGRDFPRRFRRWRCDMRNQGAAAWAFTTPASVDYWIGGDNSLQSHPNGTAIHPDLYGFGVAGAVVDYQHRTIFVNLNTDVATNTAHTDGAYGEREGGGIYWPAKNCTLHGGGGNITAPILRVTPNPTVGGTPVSQVLNTPPIRWHGGSHISSGVFGSINVHPGNPNKLLMLSSTTQAAYEGTMSGNTITWNQIGNHPFTQVARVVCALHKMGAIWCIGRTDGGTAFSLLWKPPP